MQKLYQPIGESDPNIPDIEKFNHLISCLSGEALGTVKAFQITEQNYPKALASLKKVYDNNCLIFFDNVSTLFNLPEITKTICICFTQYDRHGFCDIRFAFVIG